MKSPPLSPRALLAFALVAFAMVCARPRDARAQGMGTRPTIGQESPGGGSNTTPPELDGVDLVEHLGASTPLDATYKDASGKVVRLGDYFDGKRPVLFVFAYHTCPMLCSLVLDATVNALKDVAWTVGKEFDVVSVSIDPHDTPETATKKRDEIVAKYGRGGPAGWHFLVGDETNIRKASDAIGFKYRYDERQGQYAHPAAIYLLTPEGKIARYLYGIQYPPGDIRFGLLEASEGRSVTTVERLLMYCYHYDPQGKKYSLVAMNVMRLGGAVTMVLLGGLLVILWMRERRKRATKATLLGNEPGPDASPRPSKA